MLAWRLCRALFADLSGEGASRYGGRWNLPGRPIVYAASSAALAVLEVRVHLDLPLDLVPDDYVLLTIDLGEVSVELVKSVPAAPSAFGDTWLRERRTSVLQVPSAIVAESSNLLLNPLHGDAKSFRMVEQRPFSFDRRLWSSS